MNLARLGDESVAALRRIRLARLRGPRVDQRGAAARGRTASPTRCGSSASAPATGSVVLLPNCPEVLQAYARILAGGRRDRAGRVPAQSAEEVRHILADSEAKVVVTAPEFLDKVDGWTGPGRAGRRRRRAASPGTTWWPGEPDRVTMVERGRRRPRGHPLHGGDHRPAQGRRAVARQSRLQRARRGQPLRARPHGRGR